jgi:hypothetical protein
MIFSESLFELKISILRTPGGTGTKAISRTGIARSEESVEEVYKGTGYEVSLPHLNM